MTNLPSPNMPSAIALTPTALRKQREMLGYRYYDSVRLTAATPAMNSYQFFKDVQGKDIMRTNMNVGGYLPADEVFEIKAIAMTFAPPDLDWINYTGATTLSGATGVGPLSQPFKMGYWILHIGDKDYNKGPIHEIYTTKSEEVWFGPAALDGFEHQDTPFFKASGLYALEVPVVLEKGIPFYVDVHWNAAVALAATADVALYIYMHLFGRRERRAIG